MPPKGKNKGRGKGIPNDQRITPPTQASTTAAHTSTSIPSMPPPRAHGEFTMVPTPGHVTRVVPPPPPPQSSIDPVPTPTHDSEGAAESGEVGGSSAGQSGHGSTANNRIKLIRVGDNWEPNTSAMHGVTHTIQKLYERPIESFGKLSKAEKERWFFEWKSHFIIHPKDEEFMFKCFKSKAAHRLQDMYIDIRERRDENPRWITQASLDYLWQYWRGDKFKAKSLKAKESRASHKGGSLHCGGSASIESTRRRMASELKRPPTQSELFRKTHTRKLEKTWVDSRSENVWHTYEQRIQEATTQREQRIAAGEDSPPVDEDKLWQEVVGGPYKNRIYGMGSFYSSSLSSASVTGGSTGTVSTADDDEVREQVHLLNAELHRMQEKDAETQRELNEMKKNMQDKEKAMEIRLRKQMKKEMMFLWKKMQAGSSAPPDTDDGGGGGGDGDGGDGDGGSDDDDDDAADFS